MSRSTARVLDLTTSISAFEAVAAIAAERAQGLDEGGVPLVGEVEALAAAAFSSFPSRPRSVGGAWLGRSRSARAAVGAPHPRSSEPAARAPLRGPCQCDPVRRAVRASAAGPHGEEARHGALFGVWAAERAGPACGMPPAGTLRLKAARSIARRGSRSCDRS